ncbi:unnamed protein product [Rhizophagus irregularis]|nr:unnamed protein product [Rhizophagus irregularis]CAB5376706.1 unnamed protein product [Rhizophagus irregularis]
MASADGLVLWEFSCKSKIDEKDWNIPRFNYHAKNAEETFRSSILSLEMPVPLLRSMHQHLNMGSICRIGLMVDNIYLEEMFEEYCNKYENIFSPL